MATVNFDQPSGGTVISNVDAFSVLNSGSGPAVRGESAGGFAAVYGNSEQNGLFGYTSSANDSGVHGHNDGSGNGVAGFSNGGFGVRGDSAGGFAAVHGHGAQNGV